MNDAPCKGCNKRRQMEISGVLTSCHKFCVDYQVYKERLEIVKKERGKQNEMDAYLHNKK